MFTAQWIPPPPRQDDGRAHYSLSNFCALWGLLRGGGGVDFIALLVTLARNQLQGTWMICIFYKDIVEPLYDEIWINTGALEKALFLWQCLLLSVYSGSQDSGARLCLPEHTPGVTLHALGEAKIFWIMFHWGIFTFSSCLWQSFHLRL